ncbi:MAG: hypothetical protein SFU84_01180 [Gemmatimonadales bacterium]|nr:hypothetical protein [Gemmatimonadales bacterium]
MAKDTCVKCGKPLPANNELASVPNARLVAFDPDANRVWRICEECNHWHLLGPQAARAALPELQSRYDAEVVAGQGQLAMASISRKLLLFRVGAPSSSTAAELMASELHAGLGSGISWQFGVAAVGMLAAIIGINVWLERFSVWKAIFDSRAPQLFFLPALAAQGFFGGGEMYRGRPAWLRWLWLLFLPLVLWSMPTSPLPMWGKVLTIAGGLGVGAWVGRGEGKPRGIRWGHDEEPLSYHDGVRGDQHGWAATTCLVFELGPEFEDRVKPEDRDAAWTLWRKHASLQSLLQSFSERRDADGLLRLTALNRPERMALLIAAGARLAEPPAEVIAGLEEAERIAAIAEALDNELSPPAPHAPLPPAPPA